MKNFFRAFGSFSKFTILQLRSRKKSGKKLFSQSEGKNNKICSNIGKCPFIKVHTYYYIICVPRTKKIVYCITTSTISIWVWHFTLGKRIFLYFSTIFLPLSKLLVPFSFFSYSAHILPRAITLIMPHSIFFSGLLRQLFLVSFASWVGRGYVQLSQK